MQNFEFFAHFSNILGYVRKSWVHKMSPIKSPLGGMPEHLATLCMTRDICKSAYLLSAPGILAREGNSSEQCKEKHSLRNVQGSFCLINTNEGSGEVVLFRDLSRQEVKEKQEVFQSNVESRSKRTKT